MERANFYIARFGLIVRQILDFSSKTVITLAEELELLRLYVELEQLRFENKFVFNVAVEDNILTRDIFIPSLLLNPIVENAIWHGLLPKQAHDKKQLNIHIKVQGNRLVITIYDNGVGRGIKREMVSNSEKNSYGIKMTEQRLVNINYLYKSNDASMVYEDVFDLSGKPDGTRVTIYLPLNLSPLKK